jgi:hypothetical protein
MIIPSVLANDVDWTALMYLSVNRQADSRTHTEAGVSYQQDRG